MKTTTGTKLDEIVTARKARLREQKRTKPQARIEAALASQEEFKGPGLFEALKAQDPKPKLIAEVKKASPSKGIIRDDFSLSEINEAYQAAPHVVAISVLTEPDYFQGSDEVLAFFAANNTQNKPLLRKDFIFDPYQVLESKLLGAQAYLLIASLFNDAKELEELISLGQKIGLEPLVEVHTREELELVKSTTARIIGVNCRDLKTFKLDIKVHELLRELDKDYARIAESGIDSREYLKYISGFSDASLIGSHFMSQKNMKDAIERMVQP